MSESMGLWLYCVTENKGEFSCDEMGIGGKSPIFEIASDGFAAIVSKEPLKKYPLVREFLLTHQRVNEKVMKSRPVLPVRFCTMAESEAQVIQDVLGNKARQTEFTNALDTIRGRAEYGLRARWKDLDKVFETLSTEDERVKETKAKVLKLASRERQAALIDVGHVVQEAVEKKNKRTESTIVQEISPYATDVKSNKVLGDANICNTALLVDDSRVEQFETAINTMIQKYENDIQFKYVGPIPAFNFVEIVIRFT